MSRARKVVTTLPQQQMIVCPPGTVLYAGIHCISREQLAKIEACEAALKAKRERAGRRTLMDEAELDEAKAAGEAVNCARCRHIGDFNAEHQKGFCMELRFQVATWRLCRCHAFEADV